MFAGRLTAMVGDCVLKIIMAEFEKQDANDAEASASNVVTKEAPGPEFGRRPAIPDKS